MKLSDFEVETLAGIGEKIGDVKPFTIKPSTLSRLCREVLAARLLRDASERIGEISLQEYKRYEAAYDKARDDR